MTANPATVAITLVLLAVGNTAPLAAQEPAVDRPRADATGDAIHPIRAPGTEAPDDFSDLAFLRDLVRDAAVVQLGELNHGGGDSFEARIRITRFLHQEMGFDLVLFETPMLLSRRMNRELAGERPLSQVVDVAIFPIWAHSDRMQELFAYIRASKTGPRPIDLYGIDAQLLDRTGEALEIGRELRDILGPAADPATTEILDSVVALVEDLGTASGVVMTPERHLRARALLGDARMLYEAPGPTVRARTSPEEREWASRMIRTLAWVVEARALRSLAPPFRGDMETYTRHPAVQASRNRRDRAMASNIAWLLGKHAPGRKAVVWLANSHAREVAGDLFPGDDRFRSVRRHTVGNHLTDILGERAVFTLLQSAHRGGYAGSFVRDEHGYRWSERVLDEAPEGTIERELHDRGVQAAIVELDERWPAGLRLRGTLSDDRPHPLHRYADALLFLDHDRPARPRPGAPTQRRDP